MTIYNIIHGPEFWLAFVVWCSGAFFGILATWLAWGVGEKRRKYDKRVASTVDRPNERKHRGAADGNYCFWR